MKRPLLSSNSGGKDDKSSEGYSMPEGLGSQHIHRLMMSKLKILRNTIDILDESIVAIKYSSNFASLSNEA